MFTGMDSFEITFWCAAVAGTAFFLLRSLVGAVGGITHDLDAGDSAHSLEHEGATGTDMAFKMISIQSLTGFFMMFGWIGLASYKQAALGPFPSLILACIAGVGTMYITASIFRAAHRLISPGSQFNISATIGQKGSVYEQIPASGKGRIQIVLDGLTREIDAISDLKVEIPSFKSIEVVSVVDKTTVSVKVLD